MRFVRCKTTKGRGVTTGISASDRAQTIRPLSMRAPVRKTSHARDTFSRLVVAPAVSWNAEATTRQRSILHASQD